MLREDQTLSFYKFNCLKCLRFNAKNHRVFHSKLQQQNDMVTVLFVRVMWDFKMKKLKVYFISLREGKQSFSSI